MKFRCPKRGRIKCMRYGGNRRNKWHYINGAKEENAIEIGITQEIDLVQERDNS